MNVKISDEKSTLKQFKNLAKSKVLPGILFKMTQWKCKM